MNYLAFFFVLALSSGFPITKKWSLARRSDNGEVTSSALPTDNSTLFFDMFVPLKARSESFYQIISQENSQKLNQTTEAAPQATSDNFYDIINQENILKINQTAEAAKLASLMKLLEEPDYEYVNVYGCSMMTMNNASDISKASYGCSYEAAVMYAISLGNASVTNVSLAINDMTDYNSQYAHYLVAMQNSLFSDWAKWYAGGLGKSFYSCAAQTKKVWGVKLIDLCEKKGPDILMSKGHIVRGIHVTNAFVPSDKIDDTCSSMSKYWNITFLPNDLDLVTYTKKMSASDDKNKIAGKYTIKNTTAPKIMNLLPNPMANMTNQNVTDIKNLLDFLNKNLFHAAACNLFELSSPIQVFGSASDSVTNVRINGQKEIELEKEERKMMILSIVLGIVGIFSMVLGPEMAIALEVAVATAGMVGTWAIEGHLSAGDVLLNLVGVFAVGIRGVTTGLKLDEIVNKFRFTRTMTAYSGLMKNFPHYTNTMTAIFGLSYGNAQK